MAVRAGAGMSSSNSQNSRPITGTDTLYTGASPTRPSKLPAQAFFTVALGLGIAPSGHGDASGQGGARACYAFGIASNRSREISISVSAASRSRQPFTLVSLPCSRSL